MVSKTFSLLFFLRKLRSDGKSNQFIYLRITVDEKKWNFLLKEPGIPKNGILILEELPEQKKKQKR